jgi:histidinol-phosphate/aromatic aminotransferase/cobyric acid decarboxylase-like protein
MNFDNRTGWEFEYSARELATAAGKQRAFRLERVAWWKAQKEKVMDEVRATGIEVSESLAMDTPNYASKALHGPQVMVRADLQQKLTECHGKIQHHQRLADDYMAWATMLVEHETTRLKIKHQDWVFFFGTGD